MTDTVENETRIIFKNMHGGGVLNVLIFSAKWGHRKVFYALFNV